MKAIVILSILLWVMEAKVVQKWLSTPLNSSSENMRIRYLIDDQYVQNSSSPIIFFTGAEASIWDYYNKTGFIHHVLAQKLGALVVYAEHRFFGESFPQKKSYKYLTVESTLRDFKALITQVKQKMPQSFVLAVGGSYSGELAVWMRMKYPHLVDGALSSSSPLFYRMNLQNLVKQDSYECQTTKVFKETDGNCSNNIREGFHYLALAQFKNETWGHLSQIFQTCKPISSKKDMTWLYFHLKSGFEYMAQGNYPYAANFITEMPAHPVNVSCHAFDKVQNGPNREIEILTGLKKASSVYYNYTGQEKCSDIFHAQSGNNLDQMSLEYLECTELATPISYTGKSMFVRDPYDLQRNYEQCQTWFGKNISHPDFDWALREMQIHPNQSYVQAFKNYRNIIFSHGTLDPWGTSGVMEYINDDLPVLTIIGGAHHLDLREPNPGDRDTNVAQVRQKEINIIQKWINRNK